MISITLTRGKGEGNGWLVSVHVVLVMASNKEVLMSSQTTRDTLDEAIEFIRSMDKTERRDREREAKP